MKLQLLNVYPMKTRIYNNTRINALSVMIYSYIGYVALSF